MRTFAWRILPFWLAGLVLGCGTLTPKGSPDELTARGRQFFDEKNYKQAERHFRAVWSGYPTSEEAEESLFMLAETRRLRRKGSGAFESYKEFAKKFPTSRYSVAAAVGEFQLGEDYLEGNMPGFLFFSADDSLGVEIMEHMQLHYRNHHLAQEALIRAADFQIKDHEYQAASILLERLLADYPSSRFRLRARYQLARSLYLMNEGPLYDERLLLKSKRGFRDFIGTSRLDGMQATYAKQIAAAERMMARIDERLAEKQYLIGKFYERTEHPKSALYYYRYCIVQFPETEYAKRCSERITKLETVPSKPEEKAAG